MSRDTPKVRHVAFRGEAKIADGSPVDAAAAAHAALRADPTAVVLVIDAESGRVVDLDLRGGDVATPQRGRPRLGVTAREVTLLPRHWDWLAQQPGGASATLRRLVEAARREGAATERARAAAEAAYNLMAALGGDRSGFEEAARALFAGDIAGLAARIAHWPPDVRETVLEIAAPGLPAATN